MKYTKKDLYLIALSHYTSNAEEIIDDVFYKDDWSEVILFEPFENWDTVDVEDLIVGLLNDLIKIVGNNMIKLEDYNTIEITESRNSYPKNVKEAIFADNFESWGDMQRFAEDNNLTVIDIYQKDGWHFWSNRGAAVKQMEIDEYSYGDNYRGFSKVGEEDFIEEEVIPSIEGKTNFSSMLDEVENLREIYDEIELMDEDEIVITHEGEYYETVKKKPLYFSEDTHHYSYALI